MSSSIQKVIIVVFLSITIISTAFILHTTHLYFTVFKGVRSFNVRAPQFYVKVVNSSYISTTTNVIIQNPSELTIELRQMIEVLYLNGKFILSKIVSIPGFIQLEPESSATLTVKAEIPSHNVPYVGAHLEGEWLIYLRIFLKAPLVNQYSWANSWTITEATVVQMNAHESYSTIMS